MAVTILGYSRTEYGFLALGELCEQFEVHCAVNGIDLKKRDEEVF